MKNLYNKFCCFLLGHAPTIYVTAKPGPLPVECRDCGAQGKTLGYGYVDWDETEYKYKPPFWSSKWRLLKYKVLNYFGLIKPNVSLMSEPKPDFNLNRKHVTNRRRR